jgi:hypothetical protein
VPLSASDGSDLDLFVDSREIVRNEVLLLLARLGEGHAGVQNLLGFQGAFDKLLDIIEAESAQEDAAAGAAAGSGGGGGGGAQSSGSGRGGAAAAAPDIVTPEMALCVNA